jgi:hypothetical protein
MKPTPIELPSGAKFDHLLDPVHEQAIRGASAANRPLLVRGEPGLGKSQLAYAAASLLGRRLISHTITANTEPQDLLWSFDAVRRLAESQVAAHSLRFEGADAEKELRQKIDVKNFVLPGPLWWAIDWGSANTANQDGLAPVPIAVSDSAKNWSEPDGIVILIDEIDKAESSVPNGLLEVFGARQIQPQGWSKPIVSKPGSRNPLVIITTNEERMLPTAFIRRCFVLELELLPCVDNQGNPVRDEDMDAFLDYFITLGKAHFQKELPDIVYKTAAHMLFEDRCEAISKSAIWRPGPAEYVDLLCAVKEWDGESKGSSTTPTPKSNAKRPKKTKDEYIELCDILRRFTLRKNVQTK